MTQEDLEETDIDREPHPSGLTHIEIKLYDCEEGGPGNNEPIEAVGIPLVAGKHYAGEENVPETAEESIQGFIRHHLSGECDCLTD